MSTLRAATVANLAGTGPTVLTGQTAAKAWCRFNGTGTVAIGASANISSLTDNGTGDYSSNITSALTDTQPCVLATSGTNACWTYVTTVNNTTMRTVCLNMGGGGATYTNVDQSVVSVAAIR